MMSKNAMWLQKQRPQLDKVKMTLYNRTDNWSRVLLQQILEILSIPESTPLIYLYY